MTSFPFFNIARTHSVNYGAVLELVEQFKQKIAADGLRIEVGSYGADLTHDAATAVRDAVVAEHRRRLMEEDSDLQR